MVTVKGYGRNHLGVEPGTRDVAHPDSGGNPIAGNSVQFRWIMMLFNNLSSMFRDRNDVFIAGDHLCYPRDGHPDARPAPDVVVVFGRPKGEHGPSRQIEEDDAATVAFKVLPPGNTGKELAGKLAYHDEYEIEEYYVVDPWANTLAVYLRTHGALNRHSVVDGFSSPRLGITFDVSGPEVKVYYPDGLPFLTFDELAAERDRARREPGQTAGRAIRLAELGRKARTHRATAAELEELEQIENETLAGLCARKAGA
jgi:hypothetical protein